MTVKVRHLLRTTGVVTPPPPTPTMFFVQQPQSISYGQDFNPTVTVQISDNANDILLISSDTCGSFIASQTVTAMNGLAAFTGLGAASYTGSEQLTCSLRVVNISRPQVVEIVSNSFYLIPVAIPATWTVLNAITTGWQGSQSSVAIGPFDSTGANAIVLAAFGDWLDNGSPFGWGDSQGNGYTGLQVQPTTAATNDPTMRLYFNVNPNTSTTHTLTWSWFNTVIRNLVVILLQGSGTSNSFIAEAGAFVLASVAAITPAPAVSIDFPGEIVITISRMLGGIVAAPTNYTALVAGAGLGTWVAYRLPDAGTVEAPTWVASTGGVSGTALIVLRTQ